MKQGKFVALLCAVFFNLIVGGAVAFASGLPMLGVLGGGAVLSTMLKPVEGLQMAVQREIWMNTIVEGLFADNSFVSKAINADGFVNQGKVVHIPNAGAPSNVVKNRTQLPADVKVRNDKDLTFNLDEYTTDPIRIPHADTVELSYNKRESVIRQDRSKLIEQVSDAFTYYWAPAGTGANAKVIRTTGETVAAHTDGATGTRKAFSKKDVNQAMVQFNKDNVPQEGRYMLLDAVMYSQLLDSMTEKEETAFHNLADLRNGVVGKLYSFNIMMRSKALRYTGGLAAKEWTTAGSATDNAAALVWWENAVCRALGEVVVFDNPGDATYYSDILSFLVRAGGRPMRDGVEGLMAIIQDVTT
ncbi:hypothetical protein LJC38_00105 [Parabacteroides sp. OttesenSCG-928-K15]|nr:hypothetical protein [Parabacteroides sp. OttesenSCG-928-K15]